MKIVALLLKPYEIFLTTGQIRQGLFISVTDSNGFKGWGEIAPLPKWSRETLDEASQQVSQKKEELIKIEWNDTNCLHEIKKLDLLPSVSFGFESALLSILKPIPNHSIPTSALLMGSPKEIMQMANIRHQEGYTSAKLKISNLDFSEAAVVINQLKDKFRLRIDVNRAWPTSQSLKFFEQFPVNAFDYVEEPFQNPNDLALFPHPLAVDESFPNDLSLKQLESLPTLKALIYKPTIQGGLVGCLPLWEWSKKQGIQIVLSSSFESDLGLAHIASLAYRLSLPAAVGIGTYYYLEQQVCSPSLRFSHSMLHLSNDLTPNNLNCKTALFRS